ncbi:hypothetical protein SAZ10_15830 [Mesorhizobium sp. BAC0120]|uniref:hypothetical protein n=1 Tax=Mesorhizobium sp. BAC0120 TaxID=3090670 RepID=UPI00298BD956|nr:hypothetical protein [Mesorhizobium sp. BAC0120]MDW6023228.1 hypothetical protein [Mesorhizobium sp. BAC0120]
MSRAVLLTGTPRGESPTRLLQAGRLEATFDAGALHWIRFNGVEILRALMFLVRTPGWGTPAPVITGLEIGEDATSFSVAYEAHYGVPGQGVRVGIRLSGEASGRLRAEADIRAEAAFDTNRTGFVVLHPLDGFAGTEVTVDHASAPQRDLVIPAQISPGQPVKDIRAITHSPVPGLTVETRFEGDVFEMEDHRNWSDASFKTYSRPIGLPYPYKLGPDAPVAQAVTITLTDQGSEGPVVSAVTVPKTAGQLLPDYALPIDRLADTRVALAWPEALGALAPSWILLRHDGWLEAPDADLSPLAELIALTGAKLEVQAILAGATDAAAEAELAALAARFEAAGIFPARIGAFAKIDEQSFQPGEARPPHPSEAAVSASLARHFQAADRIGGSPAFFTEFNRKRPDPALWQGLSFATTPVVHAADDASVMESLQSLPHILSSAQALAGGLPLLIGPTGIGARINPYGPGPSVNDPEAREGMAARDPRQRGLFAAAWTIGYLTRIAPFAPVRFAFGGPAGAFGLISTRQDYARPFWDDQPEGALYPLYHVARILARAAGGEVMEARTEGGIARLIWRKGGRRHALLANLTSEALALPATGLAVPEVLLLDAASLADNGWAGAQTLPGALDAYAVLHLEEQEAKR